MRDVKRRYTTIDESVDYWGARFYEQGDGFDDVLKRALAEQLAALSPTWSEAKPTVPGFYLCQWSGHVYVGVVMDCTASDESHYLWATLVHGRGAVSQFSVTHASGEHMKWAGPLVLPREAGQ